MGMDHRRASMLKIVDASTDTAALAQPACAATAPTSQVFDCEHWRSARLFVLGTDAEDETLDLQVVLWFDAGDAAFLPLVVFRGTATLGSLQDVLATDLGGGSAYIADTIDDPAEINVGCGVYLSLIHI